MSPEQNSRINMEIFCITKVTSETWPNDCSGCLLSHWKTVLIAFSMLQISTSQLCSANCTRAVFQSVFGTHLTVQKILVEFWESCPLCRFMWKQHLIKYNTKRWAQWGPIVFPKAISVQGCSLQVYIKVEMNTLYWHVFVTWQEG